MPGWQVISWVVVLALPVTVPASVLIWVRTSGDYDTTAAQWAALLGLGLSSMYLGFFAWYRGLSLAGVAYGSQVQQLQALLTLVWSALLLGEQVTAGTVVAAVVVIACVVWAQRSRTVIDVSPEE
jgi:drug/metabolite transporter (DMT)-like permease